MTNKPKRLGRGLEALLTRTSPVDPPIQVPVVHPSLFQGTGRPPESASTLPAVPAQGASGLPGLAALAESFGQSVPPNSKAGSEQCESATETGPSGSEASGVAFSETSGSPAVRRIALGLIDSNPMQPREDFDPVEMRSLAESIQTHGLLQPVLVRRVGDRYQLIAGERRLRAAELAGWTELPAQVIEADDRQVAEIAIIENLQRKDLNPLEKAACFQRYLETYRCTQEELASRLKIDRSTIANLIRLLELPEPIQTLVRQGRLTQGHARALLPLDNPQEQMALAERIQQEGLSVRQTEALVQQMLDAAEHNPLTAPIAPGKATRSRRTPSEHILALEQEFRSALGTKVKLVHTRSGRGRLVIFFRNHEEFERIRQQLCETSGRAARRQAG
ncbi:MAG: ParB/RepB/Spo0J family partition protein [Thermoguttaceae bacterium]|nr:ParB/RepB/Spo0J family partition protein [Thermoguttaceae bacterium]MDW8038835.1 ParB/RepB/Spo0J family partition protein [Thermoguttaceae bacterium]